MNTEGEGCRARIDLEAFVARDAEVVWHPYAPMPAVVEAASARWMMK